MGVALKSLAEEMSGRSGTLVGEVADPDLGDALRHAERDWWNQKRELHTYLDGASKAVHGAVTAYEQVEAGLSNAMHPTQGVSKHVG
jgi:hypothetical protein